MKYLFFDIECADGNKATICTFGYVLTDEKFKILRKEDLIINPQSAFNLTGREGKPDIILAYPQRVFKNAPTFPKYYRQIKALLENKDVFVVGHAVDSDVNYLNRSCARYKLEPFKFKFFDTQRMYNQYTGEKMQKSLENTLKALEVNEEFKAHKSDEDARATMLVMKALLEKMHMTLDEFLEENNHCTGKTENGKWDWDYMNPYKILRQIYTWREATHKKIKSKDMEHILLRRYVEFGEGALEKSDLLLGKKITLSAKYEKASFENTVKLINLIKSAGGEYTLKVSEADTFVKCDDKICMREAFLKAHSEFKPKFISLDKLLDTLGITYEDIESMEMPDINYLMDDKYSNKVAV